MEKETVIRIIEGLCTETEKREFFREINENEALMEEYAKIKNEYIFTRLPNYPANVALNEIKRPKVRSWWRMAINSAAVLFIPLLLYVAITIYTKKNESQVVSANNILAYSEQKVADLKYSVNNGVKGEVILPDGTKVWLNSGSTIEFPAKFDSLKRVVKLSGEGYFDVVSNKDWPLHIMTQMGYTAVVTGTTFNLSCYENDGELRLTLISGSVSLISNDTKEEILMIPNEEVVIAETASAGTKKRANINYSTAWKEGQLLFENTPMPEVIRKIERWYGVNIKVNNPGIMQFNFTAGFDSESVNQVLETLSITSNISSTLDGKNIILYYK